MYIMLLPLLKQPFRFKADLYDSPSRETQDREQKNRLKVLWLKVTLPSVVSGLVACRCCLNKP